MKRKNSFWRALYRFFYKVFSWPFIYLKYRPKIFFNKRNQKDTPLKKRRIILLNSESQSAISLIRTLFWYRKIIVVYENKDALKSKRKLRQAKYFDDIFVSSDDNYLTKAKENFEKGSDILIFQNNSKNSDDNATFDEIKLIRELNAEIMPIDLEFAIKKNGKKSWKVRLIFGNYFKVNLSKSDFEINKELNKSLSNLKVKLGLYLKYHTYLYFDPVWWFLDIGKALLIFLNWLVFPTIFHYHKNASRKDRHIKGRGVLLSKHQAFVDPPILTMHYFSRRIRTIVAEDCYVKCPWLLDHLGTIAYRRLSNKNDVTCFLKSINILRAEGVLALYPESHLSKNTLNAFASGAAYFSITTRSPVYFYVMKDPYKPFKLNHVMIGETLYPTKLFSEEELADKNTINKFTEIIYQKFNVLVEELNKYGRKKKTKKKDK